MATPASSHYPSFPVSNAVSFAKPITLQTQQALQWRHNGRDGVSNHQHLGYLLNHLFIRRPKKISKLRVTGLCEGNSLVTGKFPAQRASGAKSVSIGWLHHSTPITGSLNIDSYKWLFWLLSSVFGWYSWMNYVPDKTDSITLRYGYDIWLWCQNHCNDGCICKMLLTVPQFFTKCCWSAGAWEDTE